MKTLVEYF